MVVCGLIFVVIFGLATFKETNSRRELARDILNGSVKPSLQVLNALIQQYTSAKNAHNGSMHWTSEDETTLGSLQHLRDVLLAKNL